MAPADLPKDGGRFDLAITVGILKASTQLVPRHDLTVLELLDELGLAGNLLSVQGALPVAAVVAADLFDDCASLEACESASTDHHIRPEIPTNPHAHRLQQLRLGDVCGHALGKRALEVAAAGGHSLLIS